MKNDLPESGYQRILVIAAYIFIGAAGIFVLFRWLMPLVLPFIFAYLIAWMLQPLLRKFCRGNQRARKVVSAFLVVLILGLLCFLLFWAGSRLFEEIRSILVTLAAGSDSLFDGVTAAAKKLEKYLPFLNRFDEDYVLNMAADILKNTASSVSARLPEFVAALISALPKIIFFTVILILGCFYMTADFEKINARIKSVLPSGGAAFCRGIRKNAAQTGFRYLRAYFIVLIMTFSELLVGFFILHIEYAFTAALGIALLDILPVFGVGTILVPWSGVLFLRGDYYTAFGLLIIFGAVSVIRQLAEPRIVGRSLGLAPLLTLMGMYAGFKLFGIAGLIFAPIVLIMVKNLFFREEEEAEHPEGRPPGERSSRAVFEKRRNAIGRFSFFVYFL